MSRRTHLMRTVPGIDSLFQPLEDEIRQCFLPALTGDTVVLTRIAEQAIGKMMLSLLEMRKCCNHHQSRYMFYYITLDVLSRIPCIVFSDPHAN